MAYSYTQYTGDGQTRDYPVSIPYLSRDHIHVYVDGVPVQFAWVNDGLIRTTLTPVQGSTVRIFRLTPRDSRIVQFTKASILNEADLNNSALQLFYTIQELLDTEMPEGVYPGSITEEYLAGYLSDKINTPAEVKESWLLWLMAQGKWPSEFDPDTAYEVNDYVSYNGDIYYCILETTVPSPDPTDVNHWKKASTLIQSLYDAHLATENLDAAILDLDAAVLDLDAAVVNLNDAVAALDGRTSAAEAGIVVLEGQIVLKASQVEVDDISARLNQAEIDIDAAEAAILLKASQVQVDEIDSRLSQAEIDIDGAEAAIALKADQTVVTAIDARLSQAELDIDGAEAAILLKADQTTVNDIDSRLTQAEIDIDGAEAVILLKADQTTVDAIETRVSSAEVDIDGLQSTITLKADKTVTDDHETRISAAEVDIDGLQSQIVLKAAQADVDALGVRMTGAEVDIDGLQSEIVLKTYQSDFNALSGEVNAIVSEMALTANSWTVRLDGNGNVVGMGIIAYPPWSAVPYKAGAMVSKDGSVYQALKNYPDLTMTAHKPPNSAYEWWDVAWSPKLRLFCAVSATASAYNFMTSPDGVTWTDQYNAYTAGKYGVCWSPELEKFCVVGSSRSWVSSDGVSWDTNTMPRVYRSVCWSPELGKFCAVGPNGYAAMSTDGLNWSQTYIGTSSTLVGVCWSPKLSKFCLIGYNSPLAATSSDGVSWSVVGLPVSVWYGIDWSPDLEMFCAVAANISTSNVATSPDGVTWTTRTCSPGALKYGVKWIPELKLFVTAGVGYTSISFDGINWTSHTSPNANVFLHLAWSPELKRFVQVAYSGTRARVMVGATAWKSSNWQLTTEATSEVAFVTDSFKVIKADGTGAVVPFVIGTVGGQTQVGINGALVVDGSITADKITTSGLYIPWAQVSSKPGMYGINPVVGLNANANGLGYFNGSSWPIHITPEGRLFAGNWAGHYIYWDGSTFTIRGTLNADDIIAGTLSVNRLQVGSIPNSKFVFYQPGWTKVFQSMWEVESRYCTYQWRVLKSVTLHRGGYVKVRYQHMHMSNPNAAYSAVRRNGTQLGGTWTLPAAGTWQEVVSDYGPFQPNDTLEIVGYIANNVGNFFVQALELFASFGPTDKGNWVPDLHSQPDYYGW